jgi:hypothetical protein
MRIGFLFNHDQIHQVAHSLPIALALAERHFAGEIVVATTAPKLAAEVERLGAPLIGTRIRHEKLSLKPFSRGLARALGGVVPAAKVLVYRDNLDFFRSLDVLVVAEKTSLLLKTRYGLKNLKIVHTRHGAGDRAIGFDKASAGFDLVLCSGPKVRDRLVAEVGLAPDAVCIVGYPKFDLLRPPAKIFPGADPRPIVLYNPHPSPHLSSWYRDGRDILDFFLGNKDYRLIFAPHVMLFERKFVVSIDKLRLLRPGRLDERYWQSPDIRIDLGSRASTDMTYTQAADIYLGDASSQVYEFLIRPRPCLFVNSHGYAWEKNPDFAHWRAGPVIGHAAQLADGLKRARESHATVYRPIQERMVAATFDLDERPSSQRAAEAIERFVDRSRSSSLHGEKRTA